MPSFILFRLSESSNPVKPITHKFSTFLLTINIFCLLTLGTEVFLRTGFSQNILPVPYLVGGYNALEESLINLDQHIERYGNPQCIFIGSSQTKVGVNINVFEEAYHQQTGDQISCFNFGFAAATASSINVAAHIIVNRYQPNLIIYGTRSRDYSELSNKIEKNFPFTDWAQYHLGNITLKGWLSEHSYIYRYLYRYLPTFFVIPENSEEGKQWNDDVPTKAEKGYTPLLAYLDGAAVYWIRENLVYSPRKITRPFSISNEDVEGFKQMLNLHLSGKTHLLMVELPTPDPFFIDFAGAPSPTEQESFDVYVAGYAHRLGVPFWLTHHLNLISPEKFSDGKHLYISGSIEFSDWLGKQIGAAIQAGLLNAPPPKALVTSPPIKNVQINKNYQYHFGMSAETFQAYQTYIQSSLTTHKGKIFSPQPNFLSKDTILTAIGFFIEYNAALQITDHPSWFDLMVIFEKTDPINFFIEQSPKNKALLERDIAQDPSRLIENGYQYIIITKAWGQNNNFLDTFLHNNNYEFSQKWIFPPFREDYYLFRISPSGF